MTIVRVGSNQSYSDGWDKAFGGSKKSATATKKKQSKPAKKAGKKGKK